MVTTEEIALHTGYPLDENDLHDVVALHERFGLPIPAAYDELRRGARDAGR